MIVPSIDQRVSVRGLIRMRSEAFDGTVLYLAADQDVFASVLKEAGAARFDSQEDHWAKAQRAKVVVVDESYLAKNPNSARKLLATGTDGIPSRLIVIEDSVGNHSELPSDRIFACLPRGVSARQLLLCIQRALEFMSLQSEASRLANSLEQTSQELRQVNAIGIALSAQRDVHELLDMILERSRAITTADAGSVYLIEEPEEGKKQLRFKLSQNDTVETDYRERVMELDRKSLAGYVALTGQILRIDDVYHIPKTAEYQFNPSFDKSIGYRCKSMMVVAMRDHVGEIVGVIQLINRKKSAQAKLTSPQIMDEQVLPFSDKNEELISSLASQAAVALENSILNQEIEDLFEGFVNASVLAIEQRDPTTQGHSKRVAVHTVRLAVAVDTIRTGTFKKIKFNPQQIKEIRYASLLHDVGKIGVREHVLVKAKKLYDEKLVTIEHRFKLAAEYLQREVAQRKMEYLMKHGRDGFDEASRQIDAQCEEEMRVIDQYFEMIKLANEPKILATEVSQELRKIAEKTFYDLSGSPMSLLNDEEIKILSIPKGSLSDDERHEIESHVTKSFNFLRTIPWTRELKGIPEIAYGHHEKLDGSGYPRRLIESQIPIQAKMMTIADIFDALTASDRPYKKALPSTSALDILTDEAKHGFIDPDLLDIFIGARIYERKDD